MDKAAPQDFEMGMVLLFSHISFIRVPTFDC